MTRFKEIVSTGVVIDIVTGEEYNCEMRISDNLLRLMNDLDKENALLKEENKRLKQRCEELMEEKVDM